MLRNISHTTAHPARQIGAPGVYKSTGVGEAYKLSNSATSLAVTRPVAVWLAS